MKVEWIPFCQFSLLQCKWRVWIAASFTCVLGAVRNGWISGNFVAGKQASDWAHIVQCASAAERRRRLPWHRWIIKRCHAKRSGSRSQSVSSAFIIVRRLYYYHIYDVFGERRTPRERALNLLSMIFIHSFMTCGPNYGSIRQKLLPAIPSHCLAAEAGN